MAETEHTQARIAAMEVRLENIERLQRLLTGASSEVGTHIEELLREQKDAAVVYLALESGPKTQAELKEITGFSQPKLSPLTAFLVENALITKVPNHEGGKAAGYRWNDLDKTLKISRRARKIVGK